MYTSKVTYIHIYKNNNFFFALSLQKNKILKFECTRKKPSTGLYCRFAVCAVINRQQEKSHLETHIVNAFSLLFLLGNNNAV